MGFLDKMKGTAKQAVDRWFESSPPHQDVR